MRKTDDGRRHKMSWLVNTFIKGITYFAATITPTTLVSALLLSHTKGEYIAYRVPDYLIVLLLASFLSSIILCIAIALKLTIERGLSLIFSLVTFSFIFYMYEDFIATSRRLKVLVLPYVIRLSNGIHSVYVIDLGQIALTIAVIVGIIIALRIRKLTNV